MFGLEFPTGKDDDQRQMCKYKHAEVMHKGSQMDTIRFNRQRTKDGGWPPLKPNGQRQDFDIVEREYVALLKSRGAVISSCDQVSAEDVEISTF